MYTIIPLLPAHIQELNNQILFNFIVKNIPLKLKYKDNSLFSPKYNKLKVDRLSIIKVYEKKDYKQLLQLYLEKHGKSLNPIISRGLKILFLMMFFVLVVILLIIISTITLVVVVNFGTKFVILILIAKIILIHLLNFVVLITVWLSFLKRNVNSFIFTNSLILRLLLQKFFKLFI